MSTDDDYHATDTKILGLGIGTFLIGFFLVLCVFVWLLSTPCGGFMKWFSRWFSLLILLIVFLVLYFAERENSQKSIGPVTKVSLFRIIL